MRTSPSLQHNSAARANSYQGTKPNHMALILSSISSRILVSIHCTEVTSFPTQNTWSPGEFTLVSEFLHWILIPWVCFHLSSFIVTLLFRESFAVGFRSFLLPFIKILLNDLHSVLCTVCIPSQLAALDTHCNRTPHSIVLH